MINAEQMRTFVKQTLHELDVATARTKWHIPYSDEAVELLLMTAAHESHHGTYLRQIGGGPARGLYGMELRTEYDTWDNWIEHREVIRLYMKKFTKGSLEYDMKYATLMARFYYRRQPGAIPKDTKGQAAYAKKYWNTHGEATEQEYIEDYHRYALD